MKKTTTIANRARKVLKAVIETYIQDGKPVGSAVLADSGAFSTSPATIRNIMADLEAQGLLSQPHPSAGRVPTTKGYRFYVDALMPSQGLGKKERARISKAFMNTYGEFEVLKDRASGLLSQLSSCIGLVMAPKLEDMTLRHIEFVRLSRTHVLAVVVTRSMVIRNTLVRVGRGYSQTELDGYQAYLRERFSGVTLREMCEALLEELTIDHARYDAVFKKFLGAFLDFIQEGRDRRDRRVCSDDGTKLVLKAENDAAEKMWTFFNTLEKKRNLIKLLTEVMEQDGVQVWIAPSARSQGIGDFSLIAARYGSGSSGIGSLGIVGPTRLEYSRCIAMVDEVALLMNRAIARNVASR